MMIRAKRWITWMVRLGNGRIVQVATSRSLRYSLLHGAALNEFQVCPSSVWASKAQPQHLSCQRRPRVDSVSNFYILA